LFLFDRLQQALAVVESAGKDAVLSEEGRDYQEEGGDFTLLVLTPCVPLKGELVVMNKDTDKVWRMNPLSFGCSLLVWFLPPFLGRVGEKYPLCPPRGGIC
jgi:hypothetical protein